MPSISSMALAIQTVCRETPQAPCLRNTGIARSVKAASQSNATIAQPMPNGVGAAGAFYDHAANRDNNGGQNNLLGWSLPIEQGTDEADQDRNTGDCDRNRRRLCVSDATDDGNIEQHKSGGCDPGQPQPFAAAWTQDLNSCDAAHQHQQRSRREIPDGLGGEQRSILENL
jgi:hypothetical protein